ncbi:MAG: hypothetical protein JWP29_3526 [Rhodoferax sp.]|nr:hypothetical protein [Rhodoferax sp.]
MLHALRTLVGALFTGRCAQPDDYPPALPAETLDLSPILARIEEMAIDISAQIDSLKADIAAQTTVVSSVQTFIAGMSDQLTKALADAQAAGATAEQLQALTDLDSAVKANTAALASATTANTPAASDPAPATPVPVATDPAPVAAPDPVELTPVPDEPATPTA